MSEAAPSPEGRRVDFLAGVRVLELGDGVAGASATSILWSLGADVTTVIWGDHAVAGPWGSVHRRGRPATEAGGASLQSTIFDRGKELSRFDVGPSIDGLQHVIESGRDGHRFDLVVVDRTVGARGPIAPLADLDEYAEFVARCNHRAWLTISAFGLSGPRAGEVATELTVAAASGMLSAVRDEATGVPMKLGGQQSLLVTGQAAALAACHALDLATDGDPVHLDLSAVEAALAMGPVLEVGGLLLKTGSVGGAKRYGAPASFYPCTDGVVRISAMEDHQWQGVVRAMGAPGWAERFATVDARIADPDEVDRRVEAWTRTRTKQDAETVLQANGVPATAVYAPVEILESPQLAHRGSFETLAIDGAAARVVGLPFRVVAGGDEPGEGQRRSRSLRGLRMLEASRVLAVPLCGAILATLGAEVTKLEDLPRLDMYRRRGPYIDGEAGIERSAYFALMNHSKGSAAFDVDADRARLDELVGSADVVIENLGRKRATALGLGATSAPRLRPDVLAISSSGFGQDGPHADYRAYAYNLQASCALGYLTRNEDGASAEIDIAWADLISAYALATIIAAWAVGPAGNAGTGIDFAMADLIVSHFNEYLAAASLDPGADAGFDRANDLAPYAPHGVYPTGDGWVAIAVEDDERFGRLAKVLGADALADPRFADAAGRFADRRDLDAVIAAATATRAGADLAGDLRAIGIAAERVLGAADLIEDAQLRSRGFLTPVDHAEWGERRLVGLPWRRAGGPALALTAPPHLVPLEPHPA